MRAIELPLMCFSSRIAAFRSHFFAFFMDHICFQECVEFIRLSFPAIRIILGRVGHATAMTCAKGIE